MIHANSSHQAIILAGGLGTRLYPITKTIPKVLANVHGKPLLHWHLLHLLQHNIKNVYIKTQHLHEQIENFIQPYQNLFNQLGTFYEGCKTYGTAGFLYDHLDELNNQFLIIYGDNLTNINYTKFLDYGKNIDFDMLIAVKHADDLTAKGKVEIDTDYRIKSLIEKPKNLGNNKAGFMNTGLYILKKNALKDFFKVKKELDFSYDLIPSMLAENKGLYAYPMQEYVLDIGTPSALEHANKLFSHLFSDKLLQTTHHLY